MDEVLTPADLLLFLFGELEAKLYQGIHQFHAVGGFHVKIKRMAPEFAGKKVLDFVMAAGIAKFLRVHELKDRHAERQVRL